MKLLFIGAHPDDCEISAGGTAALYARAGHEVRFVSITNGDAGHHTMSGAALAARRLAESEAAARAGGITCTVMDNHDARLLPALEVREELIRLIRAFDPTLIFTHRPNDYHPDHRNASILVQDASYLLTVPTVCPEVPHLRRMPGICYLEDEFRKPVPFEPDAVVDIGPAIDVKIGMMHEHESQFYEWLPYNMGIEATVPKGADERRAWLGEFARSRARASAERHRKLLMRLYGADRGSKVEFAEAFEWCEYGLPLNPARLTELFPLA